MGLVITLREGEAFRIGRDIQVVLVKSRNGRVSVNIDAPDGAGIERLGNVGGSDARTETV